MNWSEISASEMTMAFSSFNLSSQVQFEAVTFEMPVTFEICRRGLKAMSH